MLATLRSLVNPDVAATLPIPLIMRALAVRLNPECSDGIYIQVSLRCTDTGSSYGLAIRSDVADILADAPVDASIEIETTETLLRGFLAGRISWPSAIENGSAVLTRGTAGEAAQSWNAFDPPVGELLAVALR